VAVSMFIKTHVTITPIYSKPGLYLPKSGLIRFWYLAEIQ